MITASQAKSFTAISREKNFEIDFLKIDNAIRQAADRGCTEIAIDVDELSQMKRAGFARSKIFKILLDVLLPLGYSLTDGSNYKTVYVEWR